MLTHAEYEQGSEIARLAIQSFEQSNYGPRALRNCVATIGITSRHLSRVFKEHYKLPPTRLRNLKKKKSDMDGILVQLSYRGSYPIEKILDFYKVRAIKGVEHVECNTYRRSLRIEYQNRDFKGWISVSFDVSEQMVKCLISHTLLSVLHIVVSKIRRVFDLDFDPSHLPEGIDPATRLPGSFDAFEMSTRAILGQQITVKAAHTIAGRVAATLGEPILSPWPDINTLFPRPEVFADLKDNAQAVLGELGVIKARSYAIQTLAKAIVERQVTFDYTSDALTLRKALMGIKGIGPWTADYICMRALSWPDIFLHGDVGVRHALQDQLVDERGQLLYDKERLSTEKVSKINMQKAFEAYALKHADQFKPWRSYYTLALWNSLNDRED